MLNVLDSRGKTNWVSKVKQKLYELGFGFVWLNQGVENIKRFVHVLRVRMIDCQWQEWSARIEDSNRFDMFRHSI